ncbi:MAG: DUF4040 domain-containing protein [Cyanobacteria bacterium J007]|jgi:putative multicomponent Na+:H+ antiporter subunit B|nr:MAG: DUF4040 domain-containing protein [Cyanobacteria bacterium J007]
MNDAYLYPIVGLLPLTALMLVRSQNPYHALILRGILGSVAALVYAALGAADVALTEALVGTMLAITLYAVAVRSSLVLRLGVQASAVKGESCDPQWGKLWTQLNNLFTPYHLRLELVTYSGSEELHQALLNKEIHAIAETVNSPVDFETEDAPFVMTTRTRRLYELMQKEQLTSEIHLVIPEEYGNGGGKH